MMGDIRGVSTLRLSDLEMERAGRQGRHILGDIEGWGVRWRKEMFSGVVV